jgi:hypothetical protein
VADYRKVVDPPEASRKAYAVELAAIRQERPGIRVVVYDHSFADERSVVSLSFKWLDPKTGGARSRAGMQSYRIEDGKLAETWIALQPLGSAWNDAAAQEHWTSPPPTKQSQQRFARATSEVGTFETCLRTLTNVYS